MARTKYPSDEHNILLSVEDVTLFLGVSRSWLMRALNDGHFPPAVALGMGQEELDEYLSSDGRAGGRARSLMLRWFKRDVEDWLGDCGRYPRTDEVEKPSPALSGRVWKGQDIARGDEVLLTRQEVQWFLNISGPTALGRLRADQGFPEMVLMFPGDGPNPAFGPSGRSLRYRMSDIMAWLDSRPRYLGTLGHHARKGEEDDA